MLTNVHSLPTYGSFSRSMALLHVSKYAQLAHTMTTTIGPPAKRHANGVSPVYLNWSRAVLYWEDGVLTHISLASFLCDIGKQCKTRSDAAKRGV